MEADDILSIYSHWLRGPFPGITALLSEVTATAVQTACLSNTNEHHWHMVTTPGEPNYVPLETLDYCFASHLIGHRKPDAGIYEHVERATGVDARAILFFDDTKPNIEAARQRGWSVEWIDPRREAVPQLQSHLREYGIL